MFGSTSSDIVGAPTFDGPSHGRSRSDATGARLSLPSFSLNERSWWDNHTHVQRRGWCVCEPKRSLGMLVSRAVT